MCLFRNGQATRNEHNESNLESVAIGDVIRLCHSETEGFLCAAGDKKDKRVCVHTLEEGERNSNQLFVVANPDPSRRDCGAFLESGDTFRLVNLATSLYLAVRLDSDRCVYQSDGTVRAYEMCLVDPNDPKDHRAEENSFFTFDQIAGANASSHSNTVAFGKFFGLRCTGHSDYSIRVSAVHNSPKTPQYLQTYTSSFGTAVRDTHRKTERALVHAYKATEVDNEHVFRITRVKQDFQSDVVFATSMVHYLTAFIDYMQPKQASEAADANDSKDTLRMQQMSHQGDSWDEHEYDYADGKQQRVFSETKRALHRLIISCTESEDKNPLTREGKPRIHMQRLFLNQGVTQSALAIMSTMAKASGLREDMSVLATDPAYEAAFAIASLCWRFIRQACLGFSKGGTHVVKTNLETMLSQVPYGIRVIDTLNAVFHDNVELNVWMDSPDAEHERSKLLRFAINHIREIGPVDKFLDFLANMCADNVDGSSDPSKDEEPRRYKSTCIELLRLLQYGDPFEAVTNESGHLVLQERTKSDKESNIEQQLMQLRTEAACAVRREDSVLLGKQTESKMEGEALEPEPEEPARKRRSDLALEQFKILKSGSDTHAYSMFTGGQSRLIGDKYTVETIPKDHDFTDSPETLMVQFMGAQYPVRLRTHIQSVDDAAFAFKHNSLDIFMKTRLRASVIEVNARATDENFENWIRMSDLQDEDGFQLPQFFLARLQKKNPEPPKPSLSYHIASLRLLTMMCVPENLDSLRQIHTMEELLAGLSDEQQQNHEVRALYTDFFSALYLPSIPAVATLVNWYFCPPECPMHGDEDSQQVTGGRAGAEHLGIVRDSSATVDVQGRGDQMSTPRQYKQAAEPGPWTPITTPEAKLIWLNPETGETCASNPDELVSSDLTFQQLDKVYTIIMAALINRCNADQALDAPALSFVKALLKCCRKLLHNQRLQVGLNVEYLLGLEITLRSLMTRLHSVLTDNDDPKSDRVLELISPFTEICKLYITLSELALNDYVDEFCKMYARAKATKVSAKDVHETLSKAWPTRIDGQLRDELTDLLVIEDDELRNNVITLLSKLHDRHKYLLKAIRNLVYMGDVPQSAFVRGNIEETIEHLKQSLETEGAQRSVGFMKSLASHVAKGMECRGVKQHLQRHLGVHTLLFECVLKSANKRYQTAVDEYNESQVARSSRLSRDDTTVVRAAFGLLENLCDGNSTNQVAVAELLDGLDTGWNLYMRANLGMAEACVAVYRGQKHLCETFSTKHIKSLVKICCDHVEEMETAKDPKQLLKVNGRENVETACVTLLRTLVLVDGVPIPSNQDRVLKAILKPSKFLDAEFWMEDAGDQGSLMLNNLIAAGKSETDRMSNSRLEYHLEILRLLSSCAQSDEASSRKLRMLFPIQSIASAVDNQGLLDQVRVAYLNLFEVLFVRPCAAQPAFAHELYFTNAIRNIKGSSKHGIGNDAIDSLISVLKTSISWLERTSADSGSAPTRLFPRSCDENGGAVDFIASVFESNILEGLEDWSAMPLERVADGLLDKSHRAKLLGSVVDLMVALLNSDREVVKIGVNGPPVDSPLHIIWMETMRHLVASWKASPCFDCQDSLYTKPTLTSRGDDISLRVVELERNLIDRLHKTAVSIHAGDSVDSFDQMIDLAACAWGDELKRQKLSWTKYLHVSSESTWHQKDSLTDDQFKLRRYLADIMAKSMVDVEAKSEPQKAVVVTNDTIKRTQRSSGSGYAPLDITEELNRVLDDNTDQGTNERRSVFWNQYRGTAESEMQEASRSRSRKNCVQLTRAIISVTVRTKGTHFASLAPTLFACINGAVLRASQQQKFMNEVWQKQ